MTGPRCGAFPDPGSVPVEFSGPWLATCGLEPGHGPVHEVRRGAEVFRWHDAPALARARRELAAEGVRVHIDPAPGRGQGAYVRKASERPTMVVDTYGTVFSIVREELHGWRAAWWRVRHPSVGAAWAARRLRAAARAFVWR